MNRKESLEKSIYLKGKRLGGKSALVGSIVFAFLNLVSSYVNTYLIERIDTPPWDLMTLFADIFATFIVFLFAWALSFFPARILGGRLANSLEIDASQTLFSKRTAVTRGAWFGVAAGAMICLSVLVLEFLFILVTRHGDILPGFFLSGEVIVIASICGGWTGKQLERLIMK